MENIYVNAFNGLVRKFVGGKGFNLQDDGTWVKTGISEKLIKNLPYYKLQENK
ncbi:hypothetical protein ENKO_487 [Klebsiella phage fENko-Kae01]|nr:hypothetical protein [Klebsiella phage fENko-Kae01]